jgi:hypothetical protein
MVDPWDHAANFKFAKISLLLILAGVSKKTFRDETPFTSSKTWGTN